MHSFALPGTLSGEGENHGNRIDETSRDVGPRILHNTEFASIRDYLNTPTRRNWPRTGFLPSGKRGKMREPIQSYPHRSRQSRPHVRACATLTQNSACRALQPSLGKIPVFLSNLVDNSLCSGFNKRRNRSPRVSSREGNISGANPQGRNPFSFKISEGPFASVETQDRGGPRSMHAGSSLPEMVESVSRSLWTLCCFFKRRRNDEKVTSNSWFYSD